MQKMSQPVDPFDPSISFEEKASAIFTYQYGNCVVYNRFCEALGNNESDLSETDEIPLLPVRAFKESRISTLKTKAELYFQSSGTSDMKRAVHEVPDPDLYRNSIFKGFDYFYPDNPVILSYTPGYLENPHSSLIWMLSELIKRDQSGLSRFLDIEQALDQDFWDRLNTGVRKVVLFGAAFGLVDLAENKKLELPVNSLVIETGGMKTHRREIPRNDLHERLADGFGLNNHQIHSEYGMCELLSQAYTTGNKLFKPVPWMKISIRNPDNPLETQKPGNDGLIGIIDLANIYSCSFILTEDKGVEEEPGGFKIMGRWNPENLRGCNFLVDSD
jgi:hypothetical protein